MLLSESQYSIPCHWCWLMNEIQWLIVLVGVITNTDGGPTLTAVVWIGFYRCFYVFPDGISQNNAAKIIKRHVQMFQEYSWKAIYFRIKRSKVKVTVSLSVIRQCIIVVLATGCFILSFRVQISTQIMDDTAGLIVWFTQKFFLGDGTFSGLGQES